MWKRNPFNKYNAKRTGGLASKLENSVEGILRLREAAGEIKIIKRQDRLAFHWNGVKIIGYWPDFKCLDLKTNEEFWAEAKGMEDDLWKVKLACWKAAGPGRLEVWKGNHRKPFLKEIIVPNAITEALDQFQKIP